MGLCFSKAGLQAVSPDGAHPAAAKQAEQPAPAAMPQPVKQQQEPAAPEAAAAPAPAATAAAEEEVEKISLCDTTVFPGEQGRDVQLRACRMIDTPPEPRFDAITKLMASIFKTPVSLLTLIVDDRVWFKSKVGPFGACVCRDGSWCNYILVPTKPEVLITEDASVDARFAGNPYVAGDPHIKFYAGAPLVGTGGVRYGTLCVVDLVPRSFSAEMYGLLTNFAELAVQELERDNEMLRHLVKQKSSFAESHLRLGSAVSNAVDGLALIDVRAKPWPVLYANETFAEAAGRGVEACTEQGFWDQFEPACMADEEAVMEAVDAAVGAGRPVRVALRHRASGAAMTLALRPAGTDQLTPSKPVGVPNWVRSELELHGSAVKDPLHTDTSGAVGTIDPQLASCFYLAVVEPEEDSLAGLPIGSPMSSTGVRLSEGSDRMLGPGTPEPETRPPRSMMPYGDHPLPPSLMGLEMGPLIGSGSFAKVYRGLWEGQVVAVKVIDLDRPSAVGADVLAEAVMSQGLVHPNVVRTFTYDIDSKLSAQSGERGTVYIIQQHLNRGTLIDAAEKGWFRQRRCLEAPPNVGAMLRTLREVAAGMAYLHSRDIVHRDLTGNNVLLGAAEGDAREFAAYVADFGLSRVARGEKVTSEAFGTVTHMSPETLTQGAMTPASDVWSFGVLCWELYTGGRAYPGVRPANVVYKIISGKERLKLPADAPAAFKALAERCMAEDPAQRPAFTEVVSEIEALLTELPAGQEAQAAAA